MNFTQEIIWDRHENLVIRDVHSKWHDRVSNFMLETAFKPHPLYAVLNLQEEQDINQNYLRLLKHILHDECSIIVLDEITNEIQAVALLKWMTKEWKSWTATRLVVKTGKFAEIISLCYNMISTCASFEQDDFDSLHVFEYYIGSEELKADQIFMSKFFNAICEVARHMQMPRVTFMAMSVMQQQHASDAGFIESARVIYSMFLKEGKRPFDKLRDIDEMFSALYEKIVEPLVPYYEMTVHNYIDPAEGNANDRTTSIVARM